MLFRILMPLLLVFRDLYLEIESSRLSPEQIEQIASDSKAPGLLPMLGSSRMQFPAFWRRRAIPGFMWSGGLHDALTDQADWNAPSWDVTDSGTAQLVATIKYLAGALPDGFHLQALWAGDRPLETWRVTPEELIAIASSEGLGTKTRYEVQP